MQAEKLLKQLARLSAWGRYQHEHEQFVLKMLYERARELAGEAWIDYYGEVGRLHIIYAIMQSAPPWMDFGMQSAEDKAFLGLLTSQVYTMRSGSPLFVLSQDATDALARTDIPDSLVNDTSFSSVFPHLGYYIQVGKGYFLTDSRTGKHELEGIFCSHSPGPPIDLRDKLYRALINRKDERLYRLLLPMFLDQPIVYDFCACGVGECKGTIYSPRSGSHDLNDTLASATILPGYTERIDQSLNKDQRLVMNIAAGMNYALAGNYLQKKEVAAKRRPKSKAKQRKAAQRGEVFDAYTYLSLSGPAAARGRARTGRAEGSSKRRAPAGSVVRGHWRGYWVTKASLGDRAALGTRFNEKGTKLYLVRKWVFPHVRGKPPGDSRRYKVNL